jgi:hypothetical protein
MTIKIEPEIGVPLFDDDPAVDLTVRAQAARTTALELAEHGLELKPNKEDEDVAAKITLAYADDPNTCIFGVNREHPHRIWCLSSRVCCDSTALSDQ